MAGISKEARAFISWSGGKESSLSFYKAQKLGIDISCLLNMISEDGRSSRSHGIASVFLKAQAEAIGIPIIQRKTTWENYEEEFKKAVLDLRKEDVKTGIFGDIDLQEHRDWVERVCKDIGIKPVLPLWQGQRKKMLEKFIDAGFQAIVIATQVSSLGKEWLARKIDGKFITDLKAMDGIDLCGEKGEYHTFVYDGPIFKKPVEFIIGKKILKNNHWFLELK